MDRTCRTRPKGMANLLNRKRVDLRCQEHESFKEDTCSYIQPLHTLNRFFGICSFRCQALQRLASTPKHRAGTGNPRSQPAARQNQTSSPGSQRVAARGYQSATRDSHNGAVSLTSLRALRRPQAAAIPRSRSEHDSEPRPEIPSHAFMGRRVGALFPRGGCAAGGVADRPLWSRGSGGAGTSRVFERRRARTD